MVRSEGIVSDTSMSVTAVVPVFFTVSVIVVVCPCLMEWGAADFVRVNSVCLPS